MRSNPLINKLSLLLLLGTGLTGVGCQRSTETLAASTSAGKNTNDTSVRAAVVVSEEQAAGQGADCCKRDAVNSGQSSAAGDAVAVQQLAGGIAVPDVALRDQDGNPVRFRSDVVGGRIAAINFVFTTCKGICPPMGANFAQLQRQLRDRFGDDVVLVSVSVDPTIDTPERLNAWREKFGGGPGWTLLTGAKQDVDYLLKELEVYTADKNDHSPFILIGDEAAGKWNRVHGLTAPEKIAELIAKLHANSHAALGRGNDDPRAEEGTDKTKEQNTFNDTVPEPSDVVWSSPAHKYFTDVRLVNQRGETMRLYSDLLQGKVVVINSFFSTCKGSCPIMLSSFAKIQDQFQDRLGKDLFMISITVDPNTDTPEKLALCAQQWKAREGWYFVTGEKANVDQALYKLGQYVENKESHSNIFIVGNEASGLWKKARGLSEPEQIFPLIEEVLNDKQP